MTEKTAEIRAEPIATPINRAGKMVAGQRPEHVRIAAARNPVTNGTRATLFGDQRSSGARRFRDLMKGYADEAGGTLTTSEGQVVRRLAQASVELEILEATRAAGDAIDPVAFVTLVNTQRRLLKDLDAIKRRRQAEKPTTKLKDMLASRQREAAEVAT